MTQSTLFVTDANGARQGITQTLDPSPGSSNLIPNHVLTDVNGNQAKNDAQNNLGTQAGGRSATLNLTAAAVVKGSAGRLRKIIIVAPGSTSGAFTLNNCATTGAAAAGNTIWTLPYNGTNNIAGTIFNLDWPCDTGIVLSAVPGGGSPIVAVSYD